MFEHVWRQTLKKFHDVDMHGVDWDLLQDQPTRRFLPYIDHGRDFAELLSEMLGELNASHTGSGYRLPPAGDGDQTASLGFFPDPDWSEAPGSASLEILASSPLGKAETKIEPGTIITAIDGHEIDRRGDELVPAAQPQGRRARLRCATCAARTRRAWEETVKPISLGGERRPALRALGPHPRRGGRRLSGGRIGYAHIRGMNDGSFREIFEDIFGESVDKEGHRPRHPLQRWRQPRRGADRLPLGRGLHARGAARPAGRRSYPVATLDQAVDPDPERGQLLRRPLRAQRLPHARPGRDGRHASARHLHRGLVGNATRPAACTSASPR